MYNVKNKITHKTILDADGIIPLKLHSMATTLSPVYGLFNKLIISIMWAVGLFTFYAI